MIYDLAAILEFLMLYTAFVFVSKYVFMENRIQGRIRYVFHSVVVIAYVTAFMFSEDIALLIGVLFFAVYILVERKTLKLYKALICIPMVGVVFGLFLPLEAIPEFVLEPDSTPSNISRIVLFSIIIVMLLLFQYRYDGKRDMKLGAAMSFTSSRRELSRFEKTALMIVGTLEFFSIFVLIPYDKTLEPEEVEKLLNTTLLLFGASTFVLTLVLIAVVLAGNRRSHLSDKVSDMQFNIIVTMAEIVENRDSNTGGHIQRTARYVDIIARQLKRNSPYSELMTDQFIHDLSVAAPLHDIGKIHVSDEILNFPGRLNEEQFAIMKSHAAEGKKLLQHSKMHLGNFSYLEMAIDMAGSHHEWWDGSSKGYPDSLKGEEIPLCARIMAVADVFDALTARRIYKEPMPLEKAINIILSEKGTHFDPVVVEAFIDSMSEIKAALDEFDKGYHFSENEQVH